MLAERRAPKSAASGDIASRQPKNTWATSKNSLGTFFSSRVASARSTVTMSLPRSAAIFPNSPRATMSQAWTP